MNAVTKPAYAHLLPARPALVDLLAAAVAANDLQGRVYDDPASTEADMTMADESLFDARQRLRDCLVQDHAIEMSMLAAFREVL